MKLDREIKGRKNGAVLGMAEQPGKITADHISRSTMAVNLAAYKDIGIDASTVWSFFHRAMPFSNAPSRSDGEVFGFHGKGEPWTIWPALLVSVRTVVASTFLAGRMAFVAAVLASFPALAADAERGAKVFKKCARCHAVGDGAQELRRIGPHLSGIFGRRAGTVEGFRYSKAMQRASADGLVWTADSLEIFIENPKTLVSRTRMSFGGIESVSERADLLAYLRDFSDNPRDIPEAEPTATRTDPDPPPDLIALEGDAEYGEYLAAECVTCHQADGADQGIPSITDWPRADFVRAMHAYKVKARPHPVMRMIAGSLADEEIAALAAYFAGAE